jgi:hypothetical protein
MEESLFDDHDHGKLGHPAAVRHRAPDLMVTNDNGAAGDAQGLALAGNEEDQADAGILQHVVESIYPTVAAPIRYGKRGVVETSDKSRAISLWREIDHAERIGRSDHDKGRRGNEAPTTAIERG